MYIGFLFVDKLYIYYFRKGFVHDLLQKKKCKTLQQSGNVVSNVSLGYRTPYLKRKSFYPGIKITKVYLIYFMYGS